MVYRVQADEQGRLRVATALLESVTRNGWRFYADPENPQIKWKEQGKQWYPTALAAAKRYAFSSAMIVTCDSLRELYELTPDAAMRRLAAAGQLLAATWAEYPTSSRPDSPCPGSPERS